MKKLITRWATTFVSLGLGILLANAVVGSGCQSPQTATYQAVGTTSVAVETAIHAYDVFAKAGKTTVAQNQAIAAAYAKYQLAFAAVCDAGAAYSAASTTNAAGLTGLSAALDQAIANADQSMTDLENLIRSFGVTF